MSYTETRNGKKTGVHIGEVYRKGRTFRRRFTTKKDADGYELYVKLTGEEPPALENTQRTGAPTFREAVAAAKLMKGPHKKWDLANDETLCQRLAFCETHLGHYEVTQIGEDAFDVLRAALDKIRKAGKPLADSTKNRYMTVMSGVLHCAVKKKWLQVKPEVTLYPEDNALRAILTHEDQDEVILRLMREAGHAVEAKCVEFLIETGLRRGELCGRKERGKAPLQASQITLEIDPEDGVEDGYVNLGGGQIGIEQTKNNGVRRVYVRSALAKEIKAIILAGQLPSGDHLLGTFKSARDRAGYPSNLVIHSLRHTRCTRLRNEGADLELRMQTLGHKSVKTAMRYVHLATSEQREVAKKLEKRAGDRAKKASAQVVDIRNNSVISKAS